MGGVKAWGNLRRRDPPANRNSGFRDERPASGRLSAIRVPKEERFPICGRLHSSAKICGKPVSELPIQIAICGSAIASPPQALEALARRAQGGGLLGEVEPDVAVFGVGKEA